MRPGKVMGHAGNRGGGHTLAAGPGKKPFVALVEPLVDDPVRVVAVCSQCGCSGLVREGWLGKVPCNERGCDGWMEAGDGEGDDG